MNSLSQDITQFLRREDGAAMFEFAIVFPFMLLVMVMIWEGGRIMWGFQSAISGVRDATRYLTRVAPEDTCVGGTPTNSTFAATYQTKINSIVGTSIVGNTPLLPTKMTLTTPVAITVRCVTGISNYGNVAVGKVAATVQIELPFKGLFTLMGGSQKDFSVVVADEGRLYGI